MGKVIERSPTSHPDGGTPSADAPQGANVHEKSKKTKGLGLAGAAETLDDLDPRHLAQCGRRCAQGRVGCFHEAAGQFGVLWRLCHCWLSALSGARLLCSGDAIWVIH